MHAIGSLLTFVWLLFFASVLRSQWHSHSKVVRDLRTHDRVIPYSQMGDEAEARAVYDTAIANNRRAIEWVREAEEKRAAAGAGAAAAKDRANK